jgi:hypothetical protein
VGALRSGAISQAESIGESYAEAFYQAQQGGGGQTPQEKGDQSKPKPQKSWWDKIVGGYNLMVAKHVAEGVVKGKYDDQYEKMPIQPDDLLKGRDQFAGWGFDPKLILVSDDSPGWVEHFLKHDKEIQVEVTQLTLPHYGTVVVYEGKVYDSMEEFAKTKGWSEFNTLEMSWEGHWNQIQREWWQWHLTHPPKPSTTRNI